MLILAIALAVAACAEDPKRFATVEAFRDTKRIETQLQRGVSTKEDVKRMLGEPTGSGAVFMASVQQRPQEMWFYQDIELKDIKGSKGVLNVSFRQQILVVILRDGTFDGFMWFSNEEAATGWVKDSLQGKVGR
ncbi:MAG: hypothetical protein IPN75_19170 [Dechloromonas sp.]|uniref:Lipoprotein SmpA/OmlA domain-containing protein n=1 Tax=Candidatus Dechloromonas phosphorivorans TaxID=2899244 RepID=A0A9D7LQD8_9RHOO|nr:hypothetical protein [Candidatus Dechloromonas phosphorivorans]